MMHNAKYMPMKIYASAKVILLEVQAKNNFLSLHNISLQ
jgi:hypothetical protein